jgi:uncharacterized membrane protein
MEEIYLQLHNPIAMTWLHFSLITILLYGIHDIMLKHLANAVNSTVASFAINGSAALVLFLYLLTQPGAKWRPGADFFSMNTVYLVAAGIALGVATITFMNTFNRGANLSLAVPVVYAGVIAICMLFGVLFFKETIDWRQMLGAGLAVTGIFLMSGVK